MRLLELDHYPSISLAEFVADDDIPSYAILSHTWGRDSDEVTYRDILDGTGDSKAGYSKLHFCATQARYDGLRYCWIDTCCIDKTNAAELTESINSMFRWYKNAVKCYVFLEDVSALVESDRSWQIQRSRWFTRGWTLQELIAPKCVEFFSQEQKWLGDKKSLEQQIHHITGISCYTLRGEPLARFSVNERLSWIERRSTKRPEDRAYSLLGIFDINMPAIYGEGERNAFRRLLQEIDIYSANHLLDNPLERLSLAPKNHRNSLQAQPKSLEYHKFPPPSQMTLYKDHDYRKRSLHAMTDDEEFENQLVTAKADASFDCYISEKKTFNFGFGLLSLHIFNARKENGIEDDLQGERIRLKLAYLAPVWLSQTAVLATLHFPGDSPTSDWPYLSLRASKINQSPDLLDAVHRLDVPKMKHLLKTSQAKPTDKILDLATNEPITLLEALLRAFTTVIPCSACLSKHKAFLDFLFDQGILHSLHSAEATVAFFLSMKSFWSYDRPELVPQLVDIYMRRLLEHDLGSLNAVTIPSSLFVPNGWHSYRFGGSSEMITECILATLVEGLPGFQGFKYYLFHQSQSWTLDEISGRSLWYLAILYHTDLGFQKAVRDYLRSFRSLKSVNSGNPEDRYLDRFLSIDKVLADIKQAPKKDRTIFLNTLARKGTVPMITPFLSVRTTLDLDEGEIQENYLACSAQNADPEVFTALLESGASTARAIQGFCSMKRQDNKLHDKQLSSLVDGVCSKFGQISDRDFPDPLTAVIKNDQTLKVRPDAPVKLMENNILLPKRLHGCKSVFPCHSYMFHVIYYNRIEILKLLLERGPPLDKTIKQMFATDREHFDPIVDYTWLNLAVEMGRSECTELILSESEDVETAITRLDGANRTALKISEKSVYQSHPRKSALHGQRWMDDNEEYTTISAEQDEATFRVLQSFKKSGKSPDARVTKTPGIVEEQESLSNFVAWVSAFTTQKIFLSRTPKRYTQALHLVMNQLLSLPKAFSCDNILGHCDNSGLCFDCKQHITGVSPKTQWAQLMQLSFLEGMLLRLSFISMLGLVVISDLIVLLIILGRSMKLVRRPQTSITLLGVVFLLVRVYIWDS